MPASKLSKATRTFIPPPREIEYNKFNVDKLRELAIELHEQTNLPVPAGVKRMKKAKLIALLTSLPPPPTHESYTIRALNLTLLSVEDAPVKGSGESIDKALVVNSIRSPPPIIYVDGSTVMERVNNLTDLRRGDHVCVGLNPMRKIFHPFDKFLQYLTHFELFPAYHHFVMYDDVRGVEGSVPMTGDGKVAMICEYSNTPLGAIAQAWEHGLSSVWKSPAPFMRIPLCDYVEGCSPGPALGVFRVKEDLNPSERDEIVSKMDKLLANHETYSFIYRNCEHAAFSFNPKKPVWVSPQVPYLMWNFMRFNMGLASVLLLMQLTRSDVVNGNIHRYHVISILYHLLSTVPVCLQSVIQLMRTVMSMTAKRVRNEISSTVFWHLVYKETSRAFVAGGLACLCLGMLPKMVSDTSYTTTASLLAVFAFTLSNGLFNALCFTVVRVMLSTKGEVVVPVMGKKGRRGRTESNEGEVLEVEGGKRGARGNRSSSRKPRKRE